MPQVPGKPELKACVWANDDKKEVAIPERLHATWSQHAEFAERFSILNKQIQTANAAWTEVPESTERLSSGEPTPNKAKKEEVKEEVEEPPSASQVDTGISASVTLALPNKMSLLFCDANRVIIANLTDTELVMNADLFLCGFYKGTWNKLEAGYNLDATKDMFYKLSDSNNEICMVGHKALTTIGVEMETRLTKMPTTSIQYHTMSDSPTVDNVAHFLLEPKHKVYWQAQGMTAKKEEDDIKATLNSCAGLVPVSTWEESRFTKVIWVCKWATRALQPVRPFVFVKTGFKLPPGKYVDV